MKLRDLLELMDDRSVRVQVASDDGEYTLYDTPEHLLSSADDEVLNGIIRNVSVWAVHISIDVEVDCE